MSSKYGISSSVVLGTNMDFHWTDFQCDLEHEYNFKSITLRDKCMWFAHALKVISNFSWTFQELKLSVRFFLRGIERNNVEKHCVCWDRLDIMIENVWYNNGLWLRTIMQCSGTLHICSHGCRYEECSDFINYRELYEERKIKNITEIILDWISFVIMGHWTFNFVL